jgi:hypothetical protein
VRRHFLLTRLLEEWLDLVIDVTEQRRTPSLAREPATAAWR